MKLNLKDSELIELQEQTGYCLIAKLVELIKRECGSELITNELLPRLTGQQLTLWAYYIVREEVLCGGFIQLIHNGYGGFIFLNPFAKAMRLWGLKDFSKLIYRGRELYEQFAEALTASCNDEEFMALYELYPQFDELDDDYVEYEPKWTATLGEYINNNLSDFVN